MYMYVHACDLQCVLCLWACTCDLQYWGMCACMCVCVSCVYTCVMRGVCLRDPASVEGACQQVLPSNRWASHRGLNPGVCGGICLC